MSAPAEHMIGPVPRAVREAWDAMIAASYRRQTGPPHDRRLCAAAEYADEVLIDCIDAMVAQQLRIEREVQP